MIGTHNAEANSWELLEATVGYTLEEDEFLLQQAATPPLLKVAVQESMEFRFNYWLRSRSPAELTKRLVLLAIMLQEPPKKGKRPGRPRKASQSQPSVKVTSDYNWVITVPKR